MKTNKFLTRQQLNKKARDLMVEVLEIEPYLNPNGLGNARTENCQDELLKSPYIDQFINCYLWLAALDWRTSVNTAYSSYTYKQILEELFNKDISNGALIAAAIALDMPYQKINSSPNIYLPLTEQDIKAARDGHNASQEDILKKLSEWVFYYLDPEQQEYSPTYLRKIKAANRPAISIAIHKHTREWRYEVRLDLHIGFASKLNANGTYFTSDGSARLKSIIATYPASEIKEVEEGDYIHVRYNKLEHAVDIANKFAQFEPGDVWTTSKGKQKRSR